MEAYQRIFECNAPGVIFEGFDDETVVINLDSGHYYTLNLVGARLWERLTGAIPLDEIIEDCQRDYDGDPPSIEAAVREFVSLLLSEQLLRPLASPPPRGARDGGVRPAEAARRTFEAPELAKYNDMAEMLLLDPVHDVDETGWPSAPAAAPSAETSEAEDDDVSQWPELERES